MDQHSKPSSEPHLPSTAQESLPGTARNIFAAVLLSISGGMLDAVIYILHGHVFANAMTGNVVLLGVALLAKNYAQASRHTVPIIAFAVGVWIARYLMHQRFRSPHRIALFLEIAGVALAGAFPSSLPDALLVGLIASTAAIQIVTFRTIDNLAYNTTFVTGNLRTVFESAFEAVFPATRAKALIRLRNIALITFGFALGVLLGAWAAPHLRNHTFWLVDLLLLSAAFLLD